MQKESSRRIIAVIDDNDDNRFIFRTFLEGSHDVIDFADGPLAITAMKTTTPDMVFLDIALPGTDGVEVLRRIRSDEALRQIPVFALTAHAMLGDRERFLKIGFDGYISKPINLKVILEAIELTTRRLAASGGA